MSLSCTEILRVAPCAENGSQRESLASLLVRTARENDTSPALLLERKFSEYKGLDGFRFSGRALGMSVGQSVNGSGPIAAALARRTEELTKHENLRASTTLAFAPFTTVNGLMRQQLAWNSECLRKSEIKYYPLLWALDPVRVCSETRKPLISLCPQCRAPLAMLSGGSQIGKCYRCGALLEEGKSKVVSADPVAGAIRDLDYEIWIAEQLGGYIQFQITDSLPPDFNYAATLKFWLEKFSFRVSKSSARELGASQAAMSNWTALNAIPRLRMTMNLCWVFGLSLLEFLQRQAPKNHDGKIRKPVDADVRYASAAGRRPIDKNKLEAALSSILRENKYAMMSFAEICEKKLNRRCTIVRDYFPVASRAIAKRYLENHKLTAQVGQQQYCTAVKAWSRHLHTRGIVPNHKTLKPFVERPSKLRCEWAMAALKEARIELGYEDTGEQLLLAV